MLRIESYITSIILSYVDRYIKNFRLQDAQVSLWEGDGVFHNLDLDLEVLEQELNLPFTFVSGHINELLIHVPWTRINSEPVRITINTIECVMKLRSAGAQTYVPSEKARRYTAHKTEDATSTPPSYTSNLVNKIICNLSVTCNNFILKYVEEDIVFSMNIKTLNLESVNSKWEPAFLELNPANLILRKLISLSDVTICLDKRNASGRIETYLDPLLYRCFLTMRLSQSYPSVTASRASSTRLDVFCENMAFTLSGPQVPMLMRMFALAIALQKKQLTPKVGSLVSVDNVQDANVEENISGSAVTEASWSTWAWSWVPSFNLSVGEDSVSESAQSRTLQLGFYIKKFSLGLKLCNMTVDLEGCLMELESHDSDWLNVQMGISYMNVYPSGDCCCGTTETNQLPFLTCGSYNESFLSSSLFGNSTGRRIKERSWDYHIATVTEALLLEKTPALAIDYLFVVEPLPESDLEEEEERAISSTERILLRHVADGVVVRICSGLVHRMQMLLKFASNYDYVPYATQYQFPGKQPEPVSSADKEEESVFIPQCMSCFTLFRPTFEIYPANHVPVQPSSLGRKLSKSQKRAQQANCSYLPPTCITVEWSCLDAKLTRPLNPEKTSFFSSPYKELPEELVSDFETRLSIKVVGICSTMRLPSAQPMKILELSSISMDLSTHQYLELPGSMVSRKAKGQIDQMLITLSKPKLLLIIETINSLAISNIKQKYQASYDNLFKTSLIQDAAATVDMVYLKLNVEKVFINWVQTGISECTQMSVDACQAFVIQLADKGPNLQAMILVAPDSNTKSLMTGLFQRPIQQKKGLLATSTSLRLKKFTSDDVYEQHGPIFMFCLHGIRLSVDPLLFTWLIYSPLPIAPTFTKLSQTQLSTGPGSKSVSSSKGRKISECSGGTSGGGRRGPAPQESVHSSSERETTPSGQMSTQPIPEIVKEPNVPTFVESLTSLYPIWQSTVVYVDINELSIYFPNSTLCSQLPQPMESSLQTGLKKNTPLLEVAVAKVPSIVLLCSSLKQAPFELPLPILPVILPENLWTSTKSNFPWSLRVSDFHCYTLHGLKQLELLKPLSATCTVGVSTKISGALLTSLALCVHLDTTAISISISEDQVALLAGLAITLTQVLKTLKPKLSDKHHVSDETLLSVEPTIESEGSCSTSQPGEESSEGGGTGGVKLTGWMQWTLARFTLMIYNRPTKVFPESLKLSLDVEDIFFSLDIERVYHKLKFKVSTATIQRYCRNSPNQPWSLGPFHGLVMRGHDPDGVASSAPGLTSEDPTANSSGFLTATLTRACCSNLHSKLGTPSKTTKLLQKGMTEDKFVTEIAVKLQPLDIVLSPCTIGTILNVLNPLFKLSRDRAPTPVIQPLQSTSVTKFTSSSLPLLYLDLMAVRLILPAGNTQCKHDLILIQFDGVTTSPQPENPICRAPLRMDIYQAAEKHRILSVPGSEIEDRQYQVDLISLTVSTGMWNEVKTMLIKDAVPSIQNPALDWNEGRRPSSTPPALENMLTVIPAFNICCVVAPAIVYKDTTVVCGHSIEVNAISEIKVVLSTDQIELFGILRNAFYNVLPIESEEPDNTNLAFWIPPPPIPFIPLHFDSMDSGLESFTGSIQAQQNKKGGSDIQTASVHSVNRAFSMSPAPSGQPTTTSYSLTNKRVTPKERYVPLELLITGSGISMSLCRDVNGAKSNDVQPLLHICVSQPHLFLSNQGESQKYHASVYDFRVICAKDCSSSPIVVSQDLLNNQHYSQPLFETRSGDPHPTTGIPPALVTVKWTQTGSKPIRLEVDFGRPFKVTILVDVLEFLFNVKTELLTKWKGSEIVNSSIRQFHGETKYKYSAKTENHSTVTWLKSYCSYFSTITLTSQKILCAVLTCQGTCSVGVSLDKVTINTAIAQHSVSNLLSIQALSISTEYGNLTKLLLNPWSLSLKVVLLWENWCTKPVFQVNLNSDMMSVDVSPEHVYCFQQVSFEYLNYFKLSPSTSSQSSISTSSLSSSAPEPSQYEGSNLFTAEPHQQEQHYKEDLQAGAFQFMEEFYNADDLPQAYQVIFSEGSHNSPTMAWRYPQPRALTRLFIQPLPFRDSQPGDSIDCVLQYWSDTHSAYKDFVNFSLCESAACTVALPASDSMPVVSATWRVILGIRSSSHLLINVKALGACVLVDSYFCPSLIPSIQIAVTQSCFSMTFWTEANSRRPMPAQFSRYKCDGLLPQNHNFLTLSLNQSDLTYTSWSQGVKRINLNSRVRLDVLNYRTLNVHCCIEPFKMIANLSISSDSAKYLNVVSESITCRIGPSVCHTLATASQLWSQYSTNIPNHFIIITPYVICNNSCLPFRFGQDSTNEVINLQCLQCHLYSWYSTRHPLLLRFSLILPEGRCQWSTPVQLKEGTVCITVSDEESRDWMLVVSVKNITNFTTQITVSGQLIVRNNLDNNVEFLISSERQNSLIVPAQSTPPGVILSPHFLPALRIRFPGVSFTWSGLISLKGDGTLTKRFLVKIPLNEKGNFRSIWCHVIWGDVINPERILVILNNAYKITSQLPCGATVKVNTPDLNVLQTVTVCGRGIVQDLTCPGTPDNAHKLTFHLDGRALSSSPEVPLSYSMLEEQGQGNSNQTVNVDYLVDLMLNKTQDESWPLPSSEWPINNWNSAPQPDTTVHIRVVRGKEWIEPCSLQVELQPWALLLNSLGCHISLQSSDRFMCSLPHMSVLAPPVLESTFHLGLYIGTSVHLSNSLQLSRDTSFYMPHIAGLIPLQGFINTAVDCDSVISFVNILSSDSNKCRLIHVRSSFVIANFSSKTLKIAPLIVGRDTKDNNSKRQCKLPANVDYHTFTLKPQRPSGTNIKAFPITEWLRVSNGTESLLQYLAVSEGGNFGCPILVPQSTERQSVTVLVPCNRTTSNRHINFMLLLCSEQRDGQTYLTLWDQPYPSLIIHNLTRSSIMFAKATSEKGGEAVPYSQDWPWQLRLESGCSADYQLPGEVNDIPEKERSGNFPLAVIAMESTVMSSDYNWSEGISLSPCRGRLVGVPGTSGINVAVNKRGFTIHVTISHTSHTEISPLDVRLRLLREAELNTLNMRGDVDSENLPGPSIVHKTHRNQDILLEIEQPPITSNQKYIESGTENKPGLEDVTCFIQGITVVFSVEGDLCCDCREIAALVVDDFALTVQPTTYPESDVKELLIRLTLGDMQLDNQLYSTGGYDFPVLLMTKMRESSELKPVEFSVKGSALTLVELSRFNGSALDLVLTMDVNSYKFPVLQDVSLTLTSSLILYVEDTYLLELKDHLLKAVPSYSLTDVEFNSESVSAVCKSPTTTVSPRPNSTNGNANVDRTEESEQSGILFFNLKQHETTDDKDEELFNVSEHDLDVKGICFIPESDKGSMSVEDRNFEMKPTGTTFDSETPLDHGGIYVSKNEVEEFIEFMNDIPVPREIVLAAQELAAPLRLRSLTVSPLVVLISLHTSTTFYIGLDHSPLNFSSFQRGDLVTTAYRLGHALTLHYFLGAFYGSAWALASLEMLGAPGGLARTVTSGLKDFVSLPYQGIQQGLRAFLTGIAHGSASLMRHVTAGTLTSVTKMAASWARTLDRLTLNQDDLRRTEEARRLKPQGVTQGLLHGLTEFGISLLGAMGSLVHQPLQYAVSSNPEVGLVNSIGLGVMGVITRPLSGAAELVALTGEGLLSGAGWSNAPRARSQLRAQHMNCGSESMMKYSWKIFQNSEQLLLALEATCANDYEAVVLLLTRSHLYIMNLNRLNMIKSISLSELHLSAHHSDPTLLVFRVVPLESEAEALARTRLAQFVRDSQRVITGEHETFSQSSSCDTSNEGESTMGYFVNPELRDYFSTFVSFAKRHAIGRDFALNR